MEKDTVYDYVERAERRRRRFAAAAAAVMLLSILLSLAIIVKDTHHDCSGLNCSVCVQLENAAQRLTGGGGTGTVLPAVTALVCFTLLCSVVLPAVSPRRQTLVALKVELLN